MLNKLELIKNTQSRIMHDVHYLKHHRGITSSRYGIVPIRQAVDTAIEHLMSIMLLDLYNKNGKANVLGFFSLEVVKRNCPIKPGSSEIKEVHAIRPTISRSLITEMNDYRFPPLRAYNPRSRQVPKLYVTGLSDLLGCSNEAARDVYLELLEAIVQALVFNGGVSFWGMFRLVTTTKPSGLRFNPLTGGTTFKDNETYGCKFKIGNAFKDMVAKREWSGLDNA